MSQAIEELGERFVIVYQLVGIEPQGSSTRGAVSSSLVCSAVVP
jgi:hypothetical protein